MPQVEQLSASLQDYLEAIFNTVLEKGAARTKDIVNKLGVKAGSVTGALQALSEKKLIRYAPYEVITLTPSGIEEATRVVRKHELLRDFFVQVLGVEADIAEIDACRIEHMVSDELAECLVGFIESIRACPYCGGNWIKQSHRHDSTLPKNGKNAADVERTRQNHVKDLKNQ